MTDDAVTVLKHRRDELRRDIEVMRAQREGTIDRDLRKLYATSISHRTIEIRFIDSILGARVLIQRGPQLVTDDGPEAA